jgi:hypothetical protein
MKVRSSFQDGHDAEKLPSAKARKYDWLSFGTKICYELKVLQSERRLIYRIGRNPRAPMTRENLSERFPDTAFIFCKSRV